MSCGFIPEATQRCSKIARLSSLTEWTSSQKQRLINGLCNRRQTSASRRSARRFLARECPSQQQFRCHHWASCRRLWCPSDSWSRLWAFCRSSIRKIKKKLSEKKIILAMTFSVMYRSCSDPRSSPQLGYFSNFTLFSFISFCRSATASVYVIRAKSLSTTFCSRACSPFSPCGYSCSK